MSFQIFHPDDMVKPLDPVTINTRGNSLAVILQLVNGGNIKRPKDPQYSEVFSDLWIFGDDSTKFEPLRLTAPKPEFKELADEITEYYLCKHATMSLSGRYIGPWLQQLAEALQRARKNVVYEDDFRILVKLQAHYDFDHAMMKFCEDYKTVPDSVEKHIHGEAEIRFVGWAWAPANNGRKMFLLADEHQHLYMIKPGPTSTLVGSMMDSMMNLGTTLTIRGSYIVKQDFHLPDFGYIEIQHNAEIVKCVLNDNAEEVKFIYG